MSAQLAGHGVPVNSFSAHLALAAGVTVSIHAPSMHALRNVVARLDSTEAANDTEPASTGNSSAPARGAAPSQPTTAAQTDAPKQTAAVSTLAAETAAAPSQVSTAAGEAGNASAAAPQGGSSAQAVSTSTPSVSAEMAGGEPVTFDVLKKAFLALSTKAGGRTLCEGVLKPFNLGKLSEAKPEQYAAVLANIQKAGA